MRRLLTVLAAIVLMALPVGLQAQGVAPSVMNYQGRLTDAAGSPLSGSVEMTFTIYGSASGSDVIWQETHAGVTVIDGLFHVILGTGESAAPLDQSVFAASDRWLGVTVAGAPEVQPRTRLVAVPYSQRVNTIDLAVGGTISGSLAIETSAIKEGGDEAARLVVAGEAGDSVIISPGEDIGLRVTDDLGDEAVLITGSTSGGMLQITASDAAKGDRAVTRTVEISPADNIVLKATEANEDVVVMITAGEYGGAMMITSSDAAKADPAAITGSVVINEDGIFILNESEDDTTLAFTVGGDIVGDGQLAMGENSSTTGDGSAVLGLSNTASGNFSTVAGGEANDVQADYSAILGGYADTIFATGNYSYLFGIGSTLSADSTFMVDMPHIRFGDEDSGYEFPTADGGSGQVLVTDGNGSISWVTYDGGANGWVDNGSRITLESDTDSVGIGTPNPAAKLDVAGDIMASGSIASGEFVVLDVTKDQASEIGGKISYGNEQIVLQANDGIYVTDDAGEQPEGLNRPINTATGAYLSAAGIWTNAANADGSDAASLVDGGSLLNKVTSLSISRWSSAAEPGIEHIGPDAVEFATLFDVGNTDGTISTYDPAGVALAAVKALYWLVEEHDIRLQRISELEAQLAEMADLRLRLSELEAQLNQLTVGQVQE